MCKVKEFLSSAKGRVAVVVPAVVSASMLYAPCAYAAEESAASGVGEAVSSVSAVMQLFSSYPMNVFLGCGIALAAFKVFRGAKNASGGTNS